MQEFALKLYILFISGEEAKRKSSKERSQEQECTGKGLCCFDEAAGWGLKWLLDCSFPFFNKQCCY